MALRCARSSVTRGAVVITLLMATAGAAVCRGAEWAVPDAKLRFGLRVAALPSEPSAGIVAILPDGGILPRPAPGALVLDSEGKELKHSFLWHNPGQGCALVFAPPDKGEVSIYLRSAPNVAGLGGEGRFTPGLLLYTKVGEASMDGAQQMGKETPPGKSANMGLVDFIGQMENPFGGDDDYMSYYLGWFKAPASGPVYICTISDDGSICQVDGKVVASWPGQHTRDAGRQGQFGSAVNLSAGPHRIEYFHFRKQGQPEANACWKLPGAKAGELPSTIPPSAFLHSGKADVISVEARDGSPQAVFNAYCQNYLWLKDRPLNLFVFEPLFAAGHPKDTTYVWRLDNGMEVREKEFSWVFEGSGPRSVTLAVSSSKGASTCTRVVDLPSPPPKASLEESRTRLEYRSALLERCRAVPPPKRPCADWSPDLWVLLTQVVEPYRGRGLMEELFERSRQDVLAQDTEVRRSLEDLYFEVVRYTDKKRAVSWLDRFEKEEKDAARQFEWELRRIDFYLYQMDDPAMARKTAEALQAKAVGPEQQARVLIKLGDIERLTGSLEEAVKLYSRAQDLPRPGPVAPAPGLSVSAASRGTLGGLARNRAEMKQARQQRSSATGGVARAAAGGKAEPKLQATREDWRAEAVRGSAYYTEVHDLIQKGFLVEARKALEAWELEFPLSKVAEDYPIAEAEYFMTIRDYRRALRTLQAYRKGVDISAALPQALSLELRCLIYLNRQKETQELAQTIIKRIPGHPVARDVQNMLKVMKENPAAFQDTGVTTSE